MAEFLERGCPMARSSRERCFRETLPCRDLGAQHRFSRKDHRRPRWRLLRITVPLSRLSSSATENEDEALDALRYSLTLLDAPRRWKFRLTEGLRILRTLRCCRDEAERGRAAGGTKRSRSVPSAFSLRPSLSIREVNVFRAAAGIRFDREPLRRKTEDRLGHRCQRW